MPTMKAVRIHKYGGPEVLQYEEAPIPPIGDEDVLIRVYAAAVNPLDWKVRSGWEIAWFHHAFPLILGFDVAGVIAAVGAKVNNFVIGDEVYGSPPAYGVSPAGGYAEYIAVPVGNIAHKPHTLEYIQAAAIPAAGQTAWQALFNAADLQPGQTILIQGAAGGVGVFAVQLAKWRGAHVIGTASPHNHAFLHELGADEVIDYTTTRFETVVHNVDIVLDAVGGEIQHRSLSVLKPDGLLVALFDELDPALVAARGVRQYSFGVQWSASDLAQLAHLVDTKQLQPIVSTVLPLQEVQQAHRLSESHHVRGKIVLQVVK